MGVLIDGVWHGGDYEPDGSSGRFERQASKFRNWVTADGSPGPSGEGGFKAEPGRYHLYVSYACPWAHRTLIYRVLKGLEDMIGLSVVHPYMGEGGWSFHPFDGVIPDPIHDAEYLREVYVAADPKVTGRVTVPVLWDRDRATIVSNESAEIIRMLNSAFDAAGAADIDFYPPERRDEIDRINERVYATVNNGVYRAGFATAQDAYEEAARELFESMDWLEGVLSARRYATGDSVTEADWRLLTTMLRFDAVYYGHFKCNVRRLIDYPSLWGWTRELYQWPRVADTVRLDHIKRHYYTSHDNINPTGIIPVGPALDFTEPHGRG
jgi:glutathionyl-hydroquinone reductase